MATCLVDMFRPEIGFATVALLEQYGCKVSVPEQQTCCGQPAYNAGARGQSQILARRVIAQFEDYDYVVLPSGSCAAMISQHYGRLLADDPDFAGRAREMAGRTFELSAFLADILKLESIAPQLAEPVYYHQSCSAFRALGLVDQPRRLFGSEDQGGQMGLEVEFETGFDLCKNSNGERCCGFGGAFAVKYGDISSAVLDHTLDEIEASGALLVLGADLGCLMNIVGGLRRRGGRQRVFHLTEALAGKLDGGGFAATISGGTEK